MIKTVFINLTIRKQEQVESEVAYRMFHAKANQKFEEQQNDLNALLQDGWTRFADCPVDLGVEKSIAIVLFKPDMALAVDAMFAAGKLAAPRETAAEFIEAMYDDISDPNAGLTPDKRTDRELLLDFMKALTGLDNITDSEITRFVKLVLSQ
jgi:hypothetical protein